MTHRCNWFFRFLVSKLRVSSIARPTGSSDTEIRRAIFQISLHLAGAKLLAPHLTPENHVELLDLAHHKTKRAIEIILADRAPKPDVPARVRQLPDPKPVASPVLAYSKVAESRREATRHEAAPLPPVPRSPSLAPRPLGGKRFKVQFTGDQALCDKLREAQALIRDLVAQWSRDQCDLERRE